MASLPLEGIRIIELTEVWAGPMGTSLLGDLGAQVIKVESYPRAPMTRPSTVPPGRRGFPETQAAYDRPWDASASHNLSNRNKMGIAVNLRTPQGLTALKDLVRASDILVEGYSAGTMARLGIEYDALHRERPDLVMVSMPGWGSDGPYRRYVTLGSGLDAFSGHWILRQYRDADPSEVLPVFHTDATAALSLVFAVVSALFYRQNTGKGQWIDLSQAEAFLPHLSKPIMDYAMNGRSAQTIANRNTSRAPQGVYPSKGDDKWIAISVRNDKDWEALSKVIGGEELTRNTRFQDALSRLKYQDDLDILISAWTSQQDQFEAMYVLQSVGVPSGAIRDEGEILSDPHLTNRGFFQQVSHPVAGIRYHPGQLWRFNDVQAKPHIPANMLGEHNNYVFEELLGRLSSEVDVLKASSIIGDSYKQDSDFDSRDRNRHNTI